MARAELDDSFNRKPYSANVVQQNLLLTNEEILASLRWSKMQEVPTQKGPRLRQHARANDHAVAMFARDQAALYKLGYTLKPHPDGGKEGRNPWMVYRWELMPIKVVVERANAKEMSRATDTSADIPRPPGMEYYPFQKAGVAYAITRKHTLFGDEPGLGKTCQAIGVINCTPTLRRILIICPASLKLNWRNELNKWLVRPRTLFIADSKVCPDIQDGIIIINYDVLTKHKDFLRATEWDCIICDEAHYLKNPDSGRTKMVFGDKATRAERAYGMADVPPLQADCKLLLTGTPIPNRVKELFPLLEFLDPTRWTSKWKFYQRYCGATQDNGWNSDGASNLDELQEILRSTVMIRRLKKNVLTELPPKTRRVVEFAPNGRIKELIAEERSHFGSEDEYKDAIERMAAGRVEGDRATFRKECAIEKAKMPAVLEYMDNAVAESGKVIIFVWHVEVYRLLREHFGPRAVGMNGSTPMHERQAAVEAFQNSPAVEVIVGQMITMGTGHTLTASSRVIMFEIDDVPANVTQAEDRAHRISQKDNVLVDHVMVTGTLDSRMAKNCISKQEIADKALDHTKPTK